MDTIPLRKETISIAKVFAYSQRKQGHNNARCLFIGCIEILLQKSNEIMVSFAIDLN